MFLYKKYLLKTLKIPYIKTLLELQSFQSFYFCIVFYLFNADGKSTTACSLQIQFALAGQNSFLDGVSLWVLVPTCILVVSVNGSYIFLSWFQKVE